MNFILRICVPSTLHVVAQYTEVLTVELDLTPDILKQPTFHDQVHYSPVLGVYVNENYEIHYSVDSR